MNDIWDVFAEAQHLGIEKDKLTFVPAKSYSPYFELSLEYLNAQMAEDSVIGKLEIEVNPLIRYRQIFESILMPGEEPTEEQKNLFDQCLHYLYESEQLSFTTIEDLQRSLVSKDIKAGCFGEIMKEDYDYLIKKEQSILCHFILELYKNGQSGELSGNIAKAFFPDGYCYEDPLKKKFFLYPAKKRQRESMAKIRIIKNLFLPTDYEIDVYWKKHFGIFGVVQTMELEEIELA